MQRSDEIHLTQPITSSSDPVNFHSMSKSLSSDLRQMLIFLLPLLGVLHTESLSKHLSDGLKRHALALRIAEHDENPPEEAYAAVEAEGARGSQTLHHGEEGGRNDDVGGPAGHRVEHGTHSSHFEGNQLGTNPCNGRNTGGEEGDVADDAD